MTDDSILDVADVPDVAPPAELVLAGGFAAPTLEQWRGLVAKVVKRDPPDSATPAADVPGLPEAGLSEAGLSEAGLSEAGLSEAEVRLTTLLADGIVLRPLYTADDALPDAGLPGQAPFLRGGRPAGNRGGWDVRQRHACSDPDVTREHIMEDLAGGVTSVWLGLGPCGFDLDALPEVLAEVLLDLAPIALDAGTEQTAAAEAFLALANAETLGTLGLDPLGLAARTGADPDWGSFAETLRRCARGFPRIRAAVVDALPYDGAGATDVLSVGCAIATGVAYLRAAGELPVAAALQQLEFRLPASDDQFATIAGLRAARRLWGRVAELCGDPAGGGMRIHAVTSPTVYARRDPYNNILRGAVACFAAGVGGADAVTVLPYDAAVGQPDALARRVARNTHALLVEESNVARVIDPAGGSWYVEQLTEQIAERAWAWFTEIEAAGGMAAALATGLVADRISDARVAREGAIARGEVVLTGVTGFPDLSETPLEREPLPPVPTGGLPVMRWAEPYEALRDRADRLGSPAVQVMTLSGGRPQTAHVGALLAPAGLTATTDSQPVVVVSDTPQSDLIRSGDAAVEPAGTADTRGAVLVLGADDVAAGIDRRALGSRILEALEGRS